MAMRPTWRSKRQLMAPDTTGEGGSVNGADNLPLVAELTLPQSFRPSPDRGRLSACVSTARAIYGMVPVIMSTKARFVHSTHYSSPGFFRRFAKRVRYWRDIRVYRITGYFLTRQKIPRWLFARLRNMRSIFILGNMVIVTRHDDVQTVLNRARDFELGEFSRDRMLAGDFILSIDWPGLHDDQSAVLRAALAEVDTARIEQTVARTCRNQLHNAQGSVDVTALARHAAMAIVKTCYGVSFPDDEQDEAAEWLTILASAIILLPPPGSAERAQADLAADRLRSRVDALIEARPRPADTTGDVLSVLLCACEADPRPPWLTRDWVARMISGLIVFGMATLVRTASDVIDELLDRPEALATAREAAQANDPARLLPHIYEALRFRPMLPVLARYCPRRTVIGTRDNRRRIVEADKTVWAPPLAAMHDPDAFPTPSRFRADRTPAASLVFGSGMHACIGRVIAETALLAIVGAILRLPDLHRLPGKTGRLRYEGAAAARFLVATRA